jgi:hypothetical protein
VDRLTHRHDLTCRVRVGDFTRWGSLPDIANASDSWGNKFILMKSGLTDRFATFFVSDVERESDPVGDELRCWIPAFDRLYPAAPLTHGRATYVGRVAITETNWSGSLDLLDRNVGRSARSLPITHQLRVFETNHTEFPLSAGLDVLDRIAAGLSLWSGRPIHGWSVQLLRNGRVVGRPVKRTRQEPGVTSINWTPRYKNGGYGDSQSLVELLKAAMQKSIDYTEGLLLSWYHAGIAAFTLQAGLSAVSSGLQLLGKLTKQGSGQESFADSLRRMLGAAQLEQVATGPIVRSTTGLDLSAFVKARNETAHPISGPSAFSSSEWIRLHQLGLKWFELLLLHRIGYQGNFMDRFSHKVLPVPWTGGP